MASEYRLYVNGRRGHLSPGKTAKGNARCVECLKPIPAKRRTGPWRRIHPSLFCTDLCAIKYGEYVARQLMAD